MNSSLWRAMKKFSRAALGQEDDYLQSWRDAIHLLPFQGDALILIDEIDGLEHL